NDFEEFENLDAAVVGISAQDIASHEAFAAKHGFRFPLLSDVDKTVAAAYAACAFTVYPSIAEGFGLPVLESVAHGKPCVCSGQGALGEAAAGGGCLTLSTVTATDLAGAIGRLLAEPAELAELSARARHRPIRTWRDHATDLTTWMAELSAVKN
ncbi:MAG: D-inositol-3-phosphate glycosyltransferase, partial [Verrucomicrobiota bacterium]